MGRHELREQVFKLLFRVEFNSPEEMPEQVKLFFEDGEPSYEERDAEIQEKIPQIDQLINEHTEGWDTARMGKVELTVLRIAAYEILWDEEIPAGVAIDEAVRIAKTYGQESSGGFVNAILAKFVKPGE